MSYPQPNANRTSSAGGGFFRLNTLLTSDGDIYESEQGAHGFAVGPDSDISKINIAYFDPQQPQRMSQISIGPGRPFPGFVSAENHEGLYVPSNRPGRILIWPAEIFNSTFVPEYGGIDPGGDDRVDFEIPVLDVIQYFAPGPATPGRNDKQYYMQAIPFQINAWFYVIPYYGRRYANIIVRNDDGAPQTISFAVVGVTFLLSGDGGVTAVENPLISTVAVAPNTQVERQLLASADGMYDAIYFKFTHSAGMPYAPQRTPLRITVSDREA